MVLLSLTVRTQDLVAATEGGWCNGASLSHCAHSGSGSSHRGWVVLMVLLSLTVRTQDLVAATEGGWC